LSNTLGECRITATKYLPQKKSIAVKNSMKLKNQVTSKSRHLERQLKNNFNVSTNLVVRALTGDKSALKLIGQMGNDGAKISEFAPQVREQMLAAIKATEDLNLVLGDIYKQV
jgi:hypothetical protein